MNRTRSRKVTQAFGRIALVLAGILAISPSAPAQPAPNAPPRTPQKFGAFVVNPAYPEVIFFSGEIDLLAPVDFGRAIDANPLAHILVLNSPGGFVSAGLTLADLVHSRGFSTLIPARSGCYSACAFVFLAGLERTAVGELGVHQFSGDKPDQVGNLLTVAEVIEVLAAFDTPLDVITLMLRTPPDEMRIFTPDEVERLGLNIGTVAVPAAVAAAEDELTPEIRAQIAAFLVEVSQDDAIMRSLIADVFGDLPDHVLEPATAYLRTVFMLPEFPAYFLDALPDQADRLNDSQMFQTIGTIMADAPMRGLARLSTAQQESFLLVFADLYRWVGVNDPDSCLGLFLGTIAYEEIGRLFMAFLSAATPDYVRAYYALNEDAFIAELRGSPAAATLDPRRSTAVEDAYLAALRATIDAAPNADELYRAAQFPRSVPAASLCQFVALSVSALEATAAAERSQVTLMLLLDLR